MVESKRAGDRRAQHVALLGLLLQAGSFVLLLGIWYWSNLSEQGIAVRRSYLVEALIRILSLGVPIWMTLYLVLNQIRRVGVESLETQELRRAREAGTSPAIFEFDEEGLLLEQNRLGWMIRWLLPATTIVVALLLFSFSWGLSITESFDSSTFVTLSNARLWMWFIVGVGFLCFVCARYVLAVSRLPQWGLLRAGAVCMAGSSLACALAVISLMAGSTIEWTEPLATLVIRTILFFLALEFTANFVLDLYRPGIAGEVRRPSFDSRLFGMIGEPGGIAKSIAESINYQFGFNVSSTWFYRLIQRWLFPIAVLSFAIVLAMTSVVIVHADEQIVIERFGKRASGEILNAGMHFKWPYPIEIAYRAPVKRVSEIVIGEAAEDDRDHSDEAILWTHAHEDVAELMLLVAARKAGVSDGSIKQTASGGGGTAGSVPVSLLMVSVPIEYRIKDINQYLYNYNQPKQILEAVAYQFLSDYAAGVDIDELMGPRRQAFNVKLKQLLQTRLDDLEVGIDIVFVGVRDAHPPARAGVADAFQGVVMAEIQQQTIVHAARAKARNTLISVAGSEALARSLDEVLQQRDATTVGSPEYVQHQQRVDDLMLGNVDKDIAPISGEAAAAIANAHAKSSDKINRALAMTNTFSADIAAFKVAPDLYRYRKYLEVFDTLKDTRKFLVVGDASNVVIVQDTAREAGLDQVLSESVERERGNRLGGQ